MAFDGQSRVIADFPSETQTSLAEVMALSNIAAVKVVAPPLPPLHRTRLSTAAVIGTFGTALGSGSFKSMMATTAFLSGFARSAARALLN
jgi:hypothetical protein